MDVVYCTNELYSGLVCTLTKLKYEPLFDLYQNLNKSPCWTNTVSPLRNLLIKAIAPLSKWCNLDLCHLFIVQLRSWICFYCLLTYEHIKCGVFLNLWTIHEWEQTDRYLEITRQSDINWETDRCGALKRPTNQCSWRVSY